MRLSCYPKPPANERDAIYSRDDFRCAYCGCEHHKDPEELTLDHIVARHNGGDPCDSKNLITACRSCNSSKNATELKKWHADQIRFARAPKAAANRKVVVRPVLPWGEVSKWIKNRTARTVQL